MCIVIVYSDQGGYDGAAAFSATIAAAANFTAAFGITIAAVVIAPQHIST